jgi:hypothetical protein
VKREAWEAWEAWDAAEAWEAGGAWPDAARAVSADLGCTASAF